MRFNACVWTCHTHVHRLWNVDRRPLEACLYECVCRFEQVYILFYFGHMPRTMHDLIRIIIRISRWSSMNLYSRMLCGFGNVVCLGVHRVRSSSCAGVSEARQDHAIASYIACHGVSKVLCQTTSCNSPLQKRHTWRYEGSRPWVCVWISCLTCGIHGYGVRDRWPLV